MEYHADLPLVNTPAIRQVIGTSRLLIRLNRHQVSARRGATISGASGTGKTTALSQLGRAHEFGGGTSLSTGSSPVAASAPWACRSRKHDSATRKVRYEIVLTREVRVGQVCWVNTR